jgi:predicted phosphodiesterase
MPKQKLRKQAPSPSKEEIAKKIVAMARKLGRAPLMCELTEGGVSERSVRNHFSGYHRCMRELQITQLEEPELKQDRELRLKITQLKAEKTGMEKQLTELRNENLSAQKLRDLIHGQKHVGLGRVPSWLSKVKAPKHTTGLPVLFLSDIHFDEVVKAEQIGGVNAYNREIATARIQNTFTSAVQILKKHLSKPSYPGIVCALGGDLLSGNIHEELAESNEASINLSIMALTDLLASGLELLANEFGRVFVPCVVGNHGRQHRKPRAKNKVHENHEWLIYEFLRRRFADDERFAFLIPEGPDAQFTIYGKRFLLTHGDQFRGGSGISGLFAPLMIGLHRKQKRQNQVKRPFDVMMMGHWHRYTQDESLIINGSIKGYDEYASQLNLDFEPPQQALFVMHPEFGITVRWPVKCERKARVGKVPALEVWR